MKRAVLIAGVSLASVLICVESPAAQAAGSRGLWWGVRPAYVTDAPSHRSKKQHDNDRRSESKSAREPEKAPVPKGPLHVIVSIDQQRATLFANGQPVATTRISTGMPGHPTPMGVFSVIQKSRHHVSNLYDAPMPYMQRITWSGAALHEGPLPGRPASHGCIRLTPEFAQLLWKTTKIGARVIITRDEVKPAVIESPRLDALLAATSQAALDPEPTSVVVTVADAGAMAFASAKKNAAQRAAAAHAERTTSDPQAAVPASSEAPAHAPIMPIVSLPAPSGAGEQATKVQTPGGMSDATVVLTAPRAVSQDQDKDQDISNAPTRDAPAHIESPPAPALIGPTEPTKAANAAPAEKPAVVAKQSEAPAAIAAVPAPSSAPAEKPAAIADVPLPQPAAPARAVNRKPVSLFVSLKDGKLYARQGMEPLFDMPVSIAHPEQPIGTHVFTAMGPKDGGGLRWTVVSIPSNTRDTVERNTEQRSHKRHSEHMAPKVATPAPLPRAADALDRIVLPQAALDRLAGLVLPGSSLIVSDNRLSDETSDSTEFVILTR